MSPSAEATLPPPPVIPDDLEPLARALATPESHGQQPSTAERAGWTFAALTLTFWGFQLWTGAGLYSLFSILGPGLVLAGLIAAVGAWTAHDRTWRLLQAVLAPLWLLGFAGFAFLSLADNPAYGTDAIAFNQQAASAFLHGLDPYRLSFGSALDRFMVPDTYHTWMLNGRELDLLSYPALSFLLYVPALALGTGMQTAAVFNFAAWAISILMLWRLLPRSVRWAAPVLGTSTMYVGLAVGGVTDMLFLPFLILACWRWDRFGEADAGLARWAGPVALGLAMCIKQTPWFVLPFLLVALAFESRARGLGNWWRLPGRYLAIVALTFAIVNLPFFIWSPGAFVHGMLVPFVEPTVPAGQGLIALALLDHLGGRLVYFTLIGALAVPLALFAFSLGYRVMRYAMVPLASVLFFWATRSYESYLIDLIPAAFIAASTIRPLGVRIELGRCRRPLRVALAGATVAFVASVFIALSSAQPLQLTIVGMQSTGEQQSVREITVRVTNRDDSSARPVFSVMAGQYLSRAWLPVSGPVTIPAHGTKTVVLEAPNAAAMPSLNGDWIITGFESSPASVSTSHRVDTSTDELTMSPLEINAPVPVGQRISLDVQLRDRLGSPERRAGVPVSLAQVIYSENGNLAGEAQINGAQVGQSPVTVLTDRSGLAHFTIRGAQALPEPVFFQAWIAPRNGVPHSYSGQIAIQFVNGKA